MSISALRQDEDSATLCLLASIMFAESFSYDL
jgi:hypothetical protein